MKIDKTNNFNEVTFDDVLLLPGKSDFLVDNEKKNIKITGRIAKDFYLDLPIVSAPMPGVTGEKMAITIGKAGGLGFIHPFQSINSQAEQITRVKKENVKVAGTISFNKSTTLKDVSILLQAGADLISLETGQAHNTQTIEFISKIKNAFKDIKVSASLVVTQQATKELIKAGADSIRVGIGGGSHCTTRLVTGVGRPQLSAVEDCYQIAKKYDIPIISDTGIKYSGDIPKAFAFGAEAVMIGGLLSGTDECPGEIIEKDGKKYKYSWGMCTDTAYKHQTPWEQLNPIEILRKIKRSIFNNQKLNKEFEEGVEALVPYKGSANMVLSQLKGGLIRSMWYLGTKNIKEIEKNAKVVLVSNSTHLENIPRI
ncbi:MAG: guanosine monophosphate reductase [Candidatus Pacebacteria bacterium]|nr:guanosine monophosphate reductase [Candidatus Paceibacterota bacterium]